MKLIESAVLREILSGAVTEEVVSKIHDLLSSIGENVRSGVVPLDDFIIFKVRSSSLGTVIVLS